MIFIKPEITLSQLEPLDSCIWENNKNKKIPSIMIPFQQRYGVSTAICMERRGGGGGKNNPSSEVLLAVGGAVGRRSSMIDLDVYIPQFGSGSV